MSVPETAVKCSVCNSEVKVDPSDPYCPVCHSFLSVSRPVVAQPSKVARLYVVTKDDQRVVLEEVGEPEILLGRGRLAQYALRDPDTISRVHVRFRKEGDSYYVWDEGSINGTYVEGQDIRGKGKQQLRERTQIKLVSPDSPAVVLEFKME